jgi:hypothetical protein
MSDIGWLNFRINTTRDRMKKLEELQ